MIRSMREQLMKALIAHAHGDIQKHAANVEVYLNNPVGIVKIKPSNLSKSPPCPGNNEPVSFILAFLFIYEIKKSPACVIEDKNKELIINS